MNFADLLLLHFFSLFSLFESTGKLHARVCKFKCYYAVLLLSLYRSNKGGCVFTSLLLIARPVSFVRISKER